MNSCLLKWKRENVQDEAENGSSLGFSFLERESSFSLDLQSFGPSVFDEIRSKVELRGEAYAWTPIWWSSDNSKR